MQILLNFHILKLLINFERPSNLKGMPENLEKHGKQINDRIGMIEELISRQELRSNLVGSFRNVFFKLLNLSTRVLDKNILGNKQMKELLLDFGVHQNTV
jgi:hypothetical protein